MTRPSPAAARLVSARLAAARPTVRRLLVVVALAAAPCALALAVARGARADDSPAAKALAKIAELEWTRDVSVKSFLADENVSVRRAAARALGRIAAPGDEVATAESASLATLLAARLKEEKDSSVRAELIVGLGLAGTPGAARDLVGIRDDGETAEQLLAARALRLAAQESDRPDLVRGLGLGAAIADESAFTIGILERRLRAAGVATIDTATRTALLGQLAKSKTFALVYALSAMADRREDARAALEDALASATDDDARAEAARGLARSAKPEVAPPAALFQDYADARVATEVVHALAKHATNLKARARLVELLAKHASFHVRREAATALAAPADIPGSDEDAAEIAALEKALADTGATVRANALVALATRAPAKAQTAARALIDKESATPHDRMGAARALGALVAHEPEPALKSLAALGRHDKDHRVRMAALEAMGEHGPDEDAIRLATYCIAQDQNPGVFENAADILLKKGGPDAEATLLEGYERTRDKHEFFEARETIVSQLGERGDKLTDPGKKLLALAGTDPDASVATAAAKARGDKDGAKPAPRARKKPAVEVKDLLGKTPVLEIKTSRGAFSVELSPQLAPLHVANVIALAEKKFYDGLTWHRVVSNFVIQGGCPRGDGSGDPGYTIPDELTLEPYVRGTLGMPKTATKDTGGCQLFFTHGRTPHLEGRYTVFGKITDGLAVMDLIDEGDTIESVKVVYVRKRRVS